MSGDPHSSASAARHSHVPSPVALLRVCADAIRAVLPPQVPPAEVIGRNVTHQTCVKCPCSSPTRRPVVGGMRSSQPRLAGNAPPRAAKNTGGAGPVPQAAAARRDRTRASTRAPAGYRLGARGQLGGRPGVAGLAQFSRACFGTSCLARHLLVVARCRQSSSGARNRASNSGVGARHSSAWPNHS